MSKRRPQNADSLELLLDTLCNTFGGVLFIAMLVVVLLQMAGDGHPRSQETVSSEDVLELASELEVLGRELEALSKSQRELSVTTLENSPSSVRDPSVRRAEAEAKLDEIRRRIDAKLIETSRCDAGALSQDEAAQAVKDRLTQVDREAEELNKLIDKEMKANSRTIYTPVVRSTRKRGIIVELRYDRLYVTHAYDETGDRLGPNLDEYVLLSEGNDYADVTADPSRGLPILKGPALVQALRTRLSQFTPDKYYLDLAVRTGSFESFHRFRDAVGSLGYEMNIGLFLEDGIFLDRGGQNRGVQ